MYNEYNYNKKTDINKILKKEQYKKLTLLNFIYNLFPKTLLVAKNKTELKTNGIKRVKKEFNHFFENEFIYYNEETTNFIVIDIDHKKYKIYDYIYELRNFNMIPNWIIETTHGYQLGFILEQPFISNLKYQNEQDKKLQSYAKHIQKCISYHFQGDENSFRTKGVFRNPVGQTNKKLYFYTNYKYLLADLDAFYLPTQKKPTGNVGGKFHTKNDEITNIKTIIIKLLNGELNYLNNIKEGQRNSFLWYFGMYLSKTNSNNWEDRLDFYNNNLITPIKEKELESIKKSIKRYNREKKNFITLGSYETWTKELKNIYIKNYKRKKGITKIGREEKKELYKTKIINTIIKYKKENNKIPSIRKIADILKFDKNTVNKYVKELRESEEYSYLFQK